CRPWSAVDTSGKPHDDPSTNACLFAEPGDHADRSVSLSRLAGQHNTGPGQHTTTPVSRYARIDGPSSHFSIITTFSKVQKPVAGATCHGPLLVLLKSREPSIQECHVPHCLGLTLGVHQDPVPAVQPDRGVVGVTDATSNVNTSVPLHRA